MIKEINHYLELKNKQASKISIATFLCIISPSFLILFAGLTETYPIKESIALGIGMSFLLILIAIAVYLFIIYGKDKFNKTFELNEESREHIKNKNKIHEELYTRKLGIGVVLCILSALPLILSGILDLPDYLSCACVSLLLWIVALGVKMIIEVSMLKNTYGLLLGYFKEETKTQKALSDMYWCLVTAIYLAISFYTREWQTTWIIWPVAGVLFGAIKAIMTLMGERK